MPENFRKSSSRLGKLSPEGSDLVGRSTHKARTPRFDSRLFRAANNRNLASGTWLKAQHNVT